MPGRTVAQAAGGRGIVVNTVAPGITDIGTSFSIHASPQMEKTMIDAFFDLADAAITARSLIRRGIDDLPMGQPTCPTTKITHHSAQL